MTLEDVKQLVLQHENFGVQDSKTGADLTSGVLLQIIIEMEEAGHESLLTNKLLQHLIRFYGSDMQGVLSQYLEQSISSFLDQQGSVQRQIKQLIDANPINIMKKMTDKNLGMLKAFTKPGDIAPDSDNGSDNSSGS